MLKKHALKIVWILVLVVFTAFCAIQLQRFTFRQAHFYLYAGLSFAGLAGWLYVSLRVLLFKRKLGRLLRCLLNNDYKIDCPVSIKQNDEVSGLEILMRKLGQQLGSYDSMQAEMISTLNRSLDVLYRHVSDGIIFANVDQRQFRLNPVVQGMFQVEQENITFESIEKQPLNKEFVALLSEAVQRSKVLVEGKVTLQLPIRNSRLDLFLEIVPVKDKQENVRFAVIFVTKL